MQLDLTYLVELWFLVKREHILHNEILLTIISWGYINVHLLIIHFTALQKLGRGWKLETGLKPESGQSELSMLDFILIANAFHLERRSVNVTSTVWNWSTWGTSPEMREALVIVAIRVSIIMVVYGDQYLLNTNRGPQRLNR